MSEDDCLFCKIAAAAYPRISSTSPTPPSRFGISTHRHRRTCWSFPGGTLRPSTICGTGISEIVGDLFLVAARIAAEEGIAEDGYRVVMNCNARSGADRIPHPPAPRRRAGDDLAAGLVPARSQFFRQRQEVSIAVIATFADVAGLDGLLSRHSPARANAGNR